MNVDFKKLIPHLIAVGIFILISVIYCSPVLQGKKLEQDDISRFKGMSKEIMDHREAYGEEPLWTNSMFSGMPAYQISTKYPSNLVSIAKRASMLFLGHPIGKLFIMFFGFYLLIIGLGIDYRLAIAGSIAFGMSSYFLIVLEAGHNSKFLATAYIPLVIAGILMAFRGKILWGSAITAMGLALQLNANHLQITYYTAIVVLILGIAYMIDAFKKNKAPDFFKAAAVLLVAAVIAVLPNITRLLVTYEYGEYTIRGKSDLKEEAQKSSGLDKEYAFGWSNGVGETLTILIPHYMGGASAESIGEDSELYQAFQRKGVSSQQAAQLAANAPTYWGKQPITSGPTYFGAGIIFLFLLGLQLVRGPDKWWILISTILMTMLSWGHNFTALTDLFFDYFPAYNKFRAVSMMLTLPAFTVPFLGILALDRIIKEKLKFDDIKKPLIISAAVAGGICLILGIMPSLAGDFRGAADPRLKELGWPVDALIKDRQSMLSSDAFRSLFFILLTAAVIWALVQSKLKLQHALIAFSLIFLVDLWMVDKRYLNNEDFIESDLVEVPFQATPADQQILNDPDIHYRVFNVASDPFADPRTSYFHKSIGGYHGAKLKRYQELYERHISQNNLPVLNMLNAKYFVVNTQEGGTVAQMNPQSLGNAWFVKECSFVADADEEINSLSEIDPTSTFFVDKKFEGLVNKDFKFDSTATIRLTEYKANHLVYESKSASEQLAVFSEIYYDKGWNAYVDGEKAPHFRGNYVLRGMMIPAGDHKVEFKFEPSSYRTGENIALFGSFILFAGFLGAAYVQIKNLPAVEEPKAQEEEKVVKKKAKPKVKRKKK